MLTHIFFGSDRAKGFFNCGPEIGYMIAHSTSSNFDYEHYEDIENFPIANRHNEQLIEPIKSKFDYGISAGLGMDMTGRGSASGSGLDDVMFSRKVS